MNKMKTKPLEQTKEQTHQQGAAKQLLQILCHGAPPCKKRNAKGMKYE